MIDLGRSGRRGALIVGGVLVLTGLFGFEKTRGRGDVSMMITAGVLILAGIVIGILALTAMRKYGWVIEAQGIRFDSTRANDVRWLLPWAELRALAVSATETVSQYRDPTLFERFVECFGHADDALRSQARRRTYYRPATLYLHGMPRYQGCAERHPEIQGVWQAEQLWITIPKPKQRLADLDTALRRFAPNLYMGVVPLPEQQQPRTQQPRRG